MGSFCMPKKSFSPDIKLLALRYLEEGRHTLQEICTMFSVNMTTLQVWRAIYNFGGAEALTRPEKNKMYSEEFKRRAVEYCLYRLLCNFFKSPSQQQFSAF